MSLHQLAQEVQSRGRGDDKVLMHVTPAELGGLQSLAMKHGGSLTINPETGLPEAGFLKNILPTLLGVGLSFIPGVGPLMAAGIVGGGTALATGSLQKGLMAGLGAYGGAGMGAGLASLGGASAGAASAVTPLAAGAPTVAAPLGGSIMAQPAASTLGSRFMNTAPSLVANPMTTNTLSAANQALKIPAATMGSNFAAAGRGLQTATSGLEGLKAAHAAIGTTPMVLTGSSLLSALQRDPAKPKEDKSLIRPYEFARTQNPQAYADSAPVYGQPFDSSERNYFTDEYTALKPYEAPGPEYKKAGGGMVAFQVGGPVEAMSAANAIGNNQMYPQSQIETPIYSDPATQRPIANNIVTQGLDAPVDAYTGEAKFAGGGFTATAGAKEPEMKGGYSYNYDPKTQQFTQTGAPKPQFSNGLFGKLMELEYNQKNKNTPQQPMVTGGIAEPVNQVQPQQAFTPQQPMVTGGIAEPVNQVQPQQAFTPQQPIPAYQSPEQQLGLNDFYAYMNQQMGQMGQQGYAAGGVADGHLGDYSDGGRLLKGPGDGVSDSIPAVIGNRQPARLADGEFVIPARIVSELGNGSTDAGAKKLYAMMERVQSARKKSIGKGKVAANTRSERLLPA